VTRGHNENRLQYSSSPRKTQLVSFYRASIAVVLAHLLPRAFKSIIKYLVSGLPGSDLWTRGVPVDFKLRLGIPLSFEPISLLKGTFNSHSRSLKSVFIADRAQRYKKESQRCKPSRLGVLSRDLTLLSDIAPVVCKC
jgi:hypothetical protein